MPTTITASEYTTEIQTVATDLVKEAAAEGHKTADDILEHLNEGALHEAVDSHQWIIYCAYNKDVLRHSDSDKAIEDLHTNESIGELVTEKGLDGLTTVMAFCAMVQDVNDQLDTTIETHLATLIPTVTYNLYTHWAPALVNNDVTGMSDEDEEALDRWLKRVGLTMVCVDVSEEHDFSAPDCGGPFGDCAVFTFHLL